MELDLKEMSSRLSEEIGTESWSTWKKSWLQEMKTSASLDRDMSDRKWPPWPLPVWRLEAAEWWDGETDHVHAHMHWPRGASPEAAAGAAGEAPEGDLCSKREISILSYWSRSRDGGRRSPERKGRGGAVGAGDGSMTEIQHLCRHCQLILGVRGKVKDTISVQEQQKSKKKKGFLKWPTSAFRRLYSRRWINKK